MRSAACRDVLVEEMARKDKLLARLQADLAQAEGKLGALDTPGSSRSCMEDTPGSTTQVSVRAVRVMMYRWIRCRHVENGLLSS